MSGKNPSDEKPGEREELTGARTGQYSSFQNQIYGTFAASPYPIDYDRLERAARKKLPAANYNYVAGSAGSEETARANRAAFKDWEIVPNMLVDTNRRSLEVNLFGQKHNCPILLAPIGVQGIVHPEAEEATARAAKEVGIGMILSTAATRSIEKVAAANEDGQRWYQLYWPNSNEMTVSLLTRAKKAGYTALVVTLDTFILGWRPRDLEASYLPFLHGQGLQVSFSDPAFMEMNGEDHTDTKWNGPGELPVGVEGQVRSDEQRGRLIELSMGALGQTSAGHFRTWKDLEFLRKNWGGPLIIKGIQSVQDAEKAVDCGYVDGIIVSNHGGRQVNGATGSLSALERITRSDKVRNSKLTILFDSGIRTGADVMKAIALGAHAVLLGRPYMWGLTLGGQAGVEHVVRGLLADLELTMALSGRATIKDLDRSMLVPASSSSKARL